MAEGTLQILGLGTSAVPLDYNVSGNQPLDLIAVKADFDGSAAGSDFVPVVEILSDAQHVMAQSIGSTVTAGDSVTVTFAPFLRDAAAGATGTGIQFNVDNEGGWLEIGSGNSIPFPSDMAPAGIGLKDTNSGGGVGVWDGNLGGGVTLIAGDKTLHGWTFGSGGINLFSDTPINLIGTTFITGTLAGVTMSGGIALDPDDTATGIGFLTIANLPTVNPGGSGIVWNDAGTLKIT